MGVYQKGVRAFRYALEAVGFTFVVVLFKILPLAWASALGGRIVRWGGPFLGASKTADKNLQHILPHLTSGERQHLMTHMWDHFGRVAAEYLHAPSIRKHPHYLDIEGVDVLEQVKGSPAIFFTGHLGNWQMATLAADLHGIKLTQMYRAANNPWVDAIMRYLQLQAVAQVVTKQPDGAKQLLQALRQGKSVFVLADQKMNNGLEIPFMGYPSMTASGIGKLAQKLKIPLVPVQVIRQRGVFFKVIFHAPLDPTGDLPSLMGRINTTLEGWIRQHPEQWFWVHNRWDF